MIDNLIDFYLLIGICAVIFAPAVVVAALGVTLWEKWASRTSHGVIR